ncbi:proteoglycan 4-like [Anguilla rostrata]|uniref:proteoglycan 4-like n=1 Tax=Anguilla rostrata TaxID=7938 RepID=UPI0030CD9895
MSETKEMICDEAATEFIATKSYEVEEEIQTFKMIKREEIKQKAEDDIAIDQVQLKKPWEIPGKDAAEKPKLTLKKIHTDEKELEKVGIKKTPKVPEEEAPKESTSALKKVSKLKTEGQDKETVKLKPFERTAKPGTVESEKEIQPDKTKKEPFTFKRSDKQQKDEAIKEPVPAGKKAERIPSDEEEAVILKPFDKGPKDEKAKEPGKPLAKVKSIPTQDQEKEKVELKPFRKVEPEKIKKTESPLEKEGKSAPPKAVPVKKRIESPKLEEKPVPLQKVRRSPKEPVETDKGIPLKPVELTKKGLEPKKTPSPKVEKPQPKVVESVPIDRKPSGDITKKLPPTVSQKDSIESVTLKKVPKKVSPPEETIPQEVALKIGKGKVPGIKELSPGSVQLRKVPTQLEEEVFEEQPEVEEEEDGETWGWELAPRESYGSPEECEDAASEEGALETPGMRGDRRGERGASHHHH